MNLAIFIAILAINKLLLGILMYSLQLQMPQIRAIKCYVSGSFVTSAGLLVFAFFPYPSPLWIDFSFSSTFNVLILTGDIIFLNGIFSYLGKRMPKSI